jgi:hypothetical protein
MTRRYRTIAIGICGAPSVLAASPRIAVIDDGGNSVRAQRASAEISNALGGIPMRRP